MGSISSPWAQGSCKPNVSRAWGQNAAPSLPPAAKQPQQKGWDLIGKLRTGTQPLPQDHEGERSDLNLLLVGNLAPK